MRPSKALPLLLILISLTCGCGGGGPKIALINIEGFIGPEMAQDVLADIREIKETKSVKAVVVRVDSPGGTVAASEEIYNELKSIDKEKPVFASMGTMATSGGYYIACAARKIFANEGTVTGSIGVRFEHMHGSKLLGMLGLGYESLKTGRLKDMGSFDRPLTDEEKKLLQDVLDEMHAQFVKAVSAGRHIDERDVSLIADGRIFTGAKALSLKLVDELGSLNQAITAAGLAVGIKKEPKIFRPKRPWNILKAILSSAGVGVSSVPAYLYK